MFHRWPILPSRMTSVTTGGRWAAWGSTTYRWETPFPAVTITEFLLYLDWLRAASSVIGPIQQRHRSSAVRPERFQIFYFFSFPKQLAFGKDNTEKETEWWEREPVPMKFQLHWWTPAPRPSLSCRFITTSGSESHQFNIVTWFIVPIKNTQILCVLNVKEPNQSLVQTMYRSLIVWVTTAGTCYYFCWLSDGCSSGSSTGKIRNF